MFLLVLNEPQARSILAKPWLVLSLGTGVLVAAALFGGLSPYLLAAFTLPLLEFFLARNAFLRSHRFGIAFAAAAILIGHATFLAFMQLAAVGGQRLAVNIAYASAILVGAAIGALLFGLGLGTEVVSAAAEHGET